MTLDCPRCKKPLGERFVPTPGRESDPSAHLCESCSGVWLDADDLGALCPTLAHLPERALEAALSGGRGTGLPACPRCREVPVEVHVLEVAVDFCTACHGVWLDAGEYGAAEDAREASDMPTRRAAYRSRQAAEARPTCAYCATELTPNESFMRERGAACGRCHYALEDRLAALRAEPTALERFLNAVAERMLTG